MKVRIKNPIWGVPITFLDKYCPTQFEIIWTTDRGGDGMLDKLKLPYTRYDAPVVNGNGLYKRIFIKKKKLFGTDIIITSPPYNKAGLNGKCKGGKWKKTIDYGGDINIEL